MASFNYFGKHNLIKPFILPVVEKFQFDNIDNYFLDYLQINFQIPYKHHVTFETHCADDIIATFYSAIPSLLQKKQKQFDHWYGVHFPRFPNETKHKRIAMQFSGRFWSGNTNYKWNPILNKNGFPSGSEQLVSYITKDESLPTTKIKNDIKIVYPAFQEIEAFIQHICWNIWKDRKVSHTVTRIDISRQTKSTLNPKPTFFVKKMDDHHIDSSMHVGTQLFTSFSVSRQNKNNTLSRNVPVFFKVYDKNWSKDHLNTLICDSRFKTHNVIRKEWRLSRRFFGPLSSHKIDTIQDLYSSIIKKDKILHLIKCMRLNKDIILKHDSLKYLALHSADARKQLKKLHKLPIYKLNKIFRKIIPRSPKLIISKSKSNDKSFKTYQWNRFKYSRSLLSNGLKNFSNKEREILINILKS